MQAKKTAMLRLFTKVSLLTLAGLLTVEAINPAQSWAGYAPVVLPESGSSGVGDTFSSDLDLKRIAALSTRISTELASALKTLQSRQSVSSIQGKTLSISPEAIAAIIAAADRSGTDTIDLEERLKAETGIDIDVDSLAVSGRNLESAIITTNGLIKSLSSEQLAAVVKSPTFMVLLQLLNAANQSVDDEVSTIFLEGSETIGILQMSLRQPAE
ncbi:MAG: hypothetical protein WBA76_13705 [Phormidesmis sp.]